MEKEKVLNAYGEEVEWDSHTGRWIKADSNNTKINSPEAPAAKKEINLDNALNLHASPDQPIEWFIEGIWPANSRGFIAGNPSAGKSWLALDMAISCVTGRPFLDRFVINRPGPCIFIDEESSRSGLKIRIEALIKGKNLSELEIAKLSDFKFTSNECLKIPTDRKWLVEQILETKALAVFFDSFSRIHNQKENSADEMKIVLDPLREIQIETGANLILIHHLRKESQSYSDHTIFEKIRGTSDFLAWRQVIIGVESQSTERAKLIFQLKDAPTPNSIFVVREPMPNNGILLRCEDMDQQETFRVVCQRIYEAMRGCEPQTKTWICGQVKGKQKSIFEGFEWLVRKGSMKREGKKWVWNNQNGSFPQQ